ncbi:hypothetical protein Tco_1457092, partial [Tanacetum coccineum]
IPKKAETLAVLAIHEGNIQKDKKKPESRMLKHGALSLYMGNGTRAAVEAIESFDLILPSGLITVLDNCHFAPTVTKGVVSISHDFSRYGFVYLMKHKHEVFETFKVFQNEVENQLEASGSHGLLKMSRSDKGLELIQEEETQPSKNTSKEHTEIAPTEYELVDLNEPPNYKAALADPKSDKWLEAMNT